MMWSRAISVIHTSTMHLFLLFPTRIGYRTGSWLEFEHKTNIRWIFADKADFQMLFLIQPFRRNCRYTQPLRTLFALVVSLWKNLALWKNYECCHIFIVQQWNVFTLFIYTLVIFSHTEMCFHFDNFLEAYWDSSLLQELTLEAYAKCGWLVLWVFKAIPFV